MILISVLFIGLSMFLTGYAESLLSLCVLRAVTGLGAGAMLASLAAVSSEYAPVKYKSFAVATVTAGYPLGATIGSFIAAPLMAEYGWRSVFFFGGGATIGMFLLTFYLIPESLQFLVSKRPKNALQKVNKILKRLQCNTLDELPPQSPAQEVVKTSVGALLSPQWRTKTLVLWATFFFCFITLYFLMSWIPKLVVNSGMTVSQGVYAAAAFNGGGVMGILSLGYLSAHFALFRMISFFLFLSGSMMAIFAATSGLDYLLLYLVAIGFLLQGGFTGLYAAAAKMYPTEIRATGVGWGIGLGRLGAVAGPYIGGILIAKGLSMEMNFFVFAVPMLISGFMATRLGVK
jgi:MFS family permease